MLCRVLRISETTRSRPPLVTQRMLRRNLETCGRSRSIFSRAVQAAIVQLPRRAPDLPCWLPSFVQGRVSLQHLYVGCCHAILWQCLFQVRKLKGRPPSCVCPPSPRFVRPVRCCLGILAARFGSLASGSPTPILLPRFSCSLQSFVLVGVRPLLRLFRSPCGPQIF